MILAIECFIACVLFTLMILPSLYKEPIKHIMSYPTEIRKGWGVYHNIKMLYRKKKKAFNSKNNRSFYVCYYFGCSSLLFRS